MVKIFSQGDSAIPKLVDALDDSDEYVTLHAQYMLRLIGNEQGIQSLQDWYIQPQKGSWVMRPRPDPVPLTDWDYQEIGRILDSPTTKWDDHALHYFFALMIDGSPHATELLNRIVMASAKADKTSGFSELPVYVARRKKAKSVCGLGTPETFARENAFFLSSDQMKKTKIEVLAYADERHRALVSLSQDFGYTYFVVLKRKGDCWAFQSIEQHSINN